MSSLRLSVSQVSGSEEDEDESADMVVELPRSPASARSPPLRSAQNGGDVDEVFLFDNNIPSVATRIPRSAEPADTLTLRRRNRLMRLVSDPRVYRRGLERSVSVQLDERRRHHSDDDDDPASVGLSTSWGTGGRGRIAEQPRKGRFAPSNGDRDDVANDDDEDYPEVDGGARQNLGRGRAARNIPSSLINGRCAAARRKNVRSATTCCDAGSDATTTTTGGSTLTSKMIIDVQLNSDDDDAELYGHVCNGLDDQSISNKSSAPECSSSAN